MEQIATWNQPEPEMLDHCVHETFEQFAVRQPDQLAVCGWDTDFTYAQLESYATNLAQTLVKLGVGPEMFIPFSFEKSAWALVAIIAIMKTGAAFVPINPKDPLSRISSILTDLDAYIVVSSPDNLHLWNSRSNIHTIIVDESTVTVASEAPAFLTKVSPSSAAYVIFTSGSTGRPKGVVVEHRSLTAGIATETELMGFGSESRVLQFASYTFDAFLTEVWCPLTNGGCVCVPAETARIGDIVNVINQMEVNWAFFTPSYLRLIQPQDVPTLRTLVIAGEAASRESIDVWHGKVNLIQAYGPTETTIVCMGHKIKHKTTNPANIGRALSSNSWIVDADNHDRLVPIGAAGELIISGPLVTRGYLADAEKTAKTFVQSPAWLTSLRSNPKYTRFYKTGDVSKSPYAVIPQC